MKKSKILYCIKGNEELFRFTNKSVLSYFIAKEIIIKYNETRDKTDLNDIINKSCVNICTDILMFIIYQTNDTSSAMATAFTFDKTFFTDTFILCLRNKIKWRIIFSCS